MKKNKYGMPPPSNRSEFEHNVYLTIEIALQRFENNITPEGLEIRTLQRLANLKTTPNRRLDLNTVDEQLRLESNMMHWMELMPDPRMERED